MAVFIRVLQALKYASPIIIFAYFIITLTLIQYKPQIGGWRSISKGRKIGLVFLSASTTLAYGLQFTTYLFCLSKTSDDDFVHVIAQSLLWLTLALILSELSAISSLLWSGVSIASLIVEVVPSVLTEPPSNASVVLHFIRITTLILLAIFISSASDHKVDDGSEEERQSLLAKSPVTSESSSDHIAASDGLSPRRCNISESNVDGSDSDSDSDDEEMREAQQHRIKTAGGWLGYLKAFKIFLPYVFPRNNRKLQLYLAIMLMNIVVQRALNVLHPRQLGIVIDQLQQHNGLPWRSIFLWAFYAIASSFCGIGAINCLLENRLMAWSRKELTYASLDHVMGLSITFHDEKDSGEVVKAVEQAESLNELLRLIILDLMPAILDITVSLWYITHLLDIYATFIVASMVIVFVYSTYKISLLTIAARRTSSRKERDESKLVYESVGNWFTISCFNHREHTMNRLFFAVSERSRTSLRTDDIFTVMYSLQEGFEHLGQLGVSILAAYRIVKGTSTVGDFVALESYWETLTWPLYVLGQNYRRINTALVDAERLLQLMQVKASIIDKAEATQLPKVVGAVTFRDVGFAYDNRKPILHGVSFTAQPGQTIALVGETGGGKSTVFKLLMRFYDVTAGSITIDGHDISKVMLDSLRNNFSFVAQDSVLFNMSILQNVRYGRLDATDNEVYDACKAASIHEKVLSLPRGYASIVGERGIKLSGGERQRIAIARALLKNAPLVLLDEATSAMDSQTETKIQNALARLTQGRTTFVIAHRLSTVVDADKILVVSQGRIAEEGTHDDLLAKAGKYFDLWNRQTAVATL